MSSGAEQTAGRPAQSRRAALRDVSRRSEQAASDQPVAVASRAAAPTTAELAECTCPEFCERDHELD
jgi:hypothetical protein